MTNELELYENAIEIAEDEPILPPSDIFTTNEIRSCAELYRMVHENSLNTQPEYQRNVVWNNADKTRFIDSLAKRLPIPSLCISVSNEKYEVIDGQQRISAIVSFLNENSDDDWRLSHLSDVDPKLSGKKVSEIRMSEPELYSRIRNTMLPVTSVYCDYSRSDHLEYIYKIFHRLNTGGLTLNNQEIRNCVFFGTFNNLIKKLDSNDIWLKIMKGVAGNNRLKGQERILMFFAFVDSLDKYNGRLTTFLNAYMIENRNLTEDMISAKEQLFYRVLAIAKNIKYGKNSRVMMDALLYGIAKNIDGLETKPKEEIIDLYNELMRAPEFNSESLSEGLWQKESATRRLNKAKEIFQC